MTSQNLIKRSPSMNETHYSPSVARPTKANVDADDTVYENVAATTQNKKTSSTMTMTHSTEKNAMSTQTENAKPGVDAAKLCFTSSLTLRTIKLDCLPLARLYSLV
jgi:hypothetical protein